MKTKSITSIELTGERGREDICTRVYLHVARASLQTSRARPTGGGNARISVYMQREEITALPTNIYPSFSAKFCRFTFQIRDNSLSYLDL